ncbi:Capsule biosynthesis protein CapB [Rubripirellula amarantea]|uniref:Capsule biosynthesis protein CapB n=1 Tax=Rubripirellula amarantea TaxID=2527999 RepID=A0A5C5WQD8_9BACT|nr:poly-gamma-glutamate synthase PgsB [Rubripirellula amarantea]TWT53114.1 Capsule biosynthesis protein CapB [Rubripirellula amarantea]
MSSLSTLVLLASMTCVGFLGEAWLYRRRLNRIPIRIHVNGTRGKSSVARLIAAGLRGGGIRTCAKTTGTLARMIFPSGKEIPIFRPGRANVIEQKRVVRAAVESNAEALVIECMALQPLLQSTCELQLVRSTHGVITNARADHLDVMGPTRLDVATALAGTTPVCGELFTAETREDSLAVMKRATMDRGSELVVVNQSDAAAISDEELARFSYLEHRDNVALALRVCASIGVDRQDALRGMWAATPDPGAMRVHQTMVAGRSHWKFVNGFAANDPESTEQLWETAFDRFPGVEHRVMVMNCRADRPDRSETMGSAIGAWTRADQVIVMGTGKEMFTRAAIRSGIEKSKIISLDDSTSEDVLEAICTASALQSPAVMIMGIGNVYGPGFELADFFEAHDCWDPAVVPTASNSNLNARQLVGAS